MASFLVNNAVVFLPKEEMDEETMAQIEKMSSNPLAQHVRFMPDCHKSSGCCVGFTDMIQKGIVPSYVGGDIGCGILSCNSGIRLREKKYERVEKIIRQCVPVGENVHNRPIVEDLERIYQASNVQLEQLKTMYDMGNFSYDNDYFEQLCAKIKCNRGHILNCLGTLGAGNHYFEVNVNAEGYAFFTVHSGSRFLGQQVCYYHQARLKDKLKFNSDTFFKETKKFKKLKRKDRDIAEEALYQQMMQKIKPSEPYLNKEEMKEYLVDMIFTQNYASENRRLMVSCVLESLGIEQPIETIETIHNYIDFNRMIIRKGAISAEDGEICIVSLNMRDGILICRGKGNEQWNYSSAHGCGRKFDRKTSRGLDFKEFQREMEGVYSTSITKNTLDESPMAYKDVDLIKTCLTDSVDIIEQLRPIINVKG